MIGVCVADFYRHLLWLVWLCKHVCLFAANNFVIWCSYSCRLLFIHVLCYEWDEGMPIGLIVICQTVINLPFVVQYNMLVSKRSKECTTLLY